MKVRFDGSCIEQVRWGENDDPSDLLTIGEVYEVLNKEVHSWHTKIILVDFPEKKFNSCSFTTIY